MSATWEPCRNAVHRLIQYLDVLAIALHQFRQLTFRMPPATDPDWERQRRVLLDDFEAVKRVLFPPDDITPSHTAARLGADAIAALVLAGVGDETAVRDSQAWLSRVGWLTPIDAQLAPYMEGGRVF